MSLTKIKDAAVKIIRELPNRPTGTGYMSAAALKAAFDQAAENIKEAVNQMIGQLENSGGAAEIGFQSSTEVPADNVQEAVENVQEQIAGVSQGAVANGSITAEKMAAGAVAMWTDISEQITLTVPDQSPSVVTVKGKEYKYNAVLGIVYFKVRIDLSTVGAVPILIYQTSDYQPPEAGLVGHVASVYSEEPYQITTSYPLGVTAQIRSVNDRSMIQLTTGEAVDGLFWVSGLYFCDGPGESEEA